MRRWMLLAVRLYPRGWRERYSDEFDALLEECKPSWRELWDVMKGAVRMQFRMGTAYLRMIAAMAVVGMTVAAVVSLRAPKVYVSSAVVRMPPREIDGWQQHALSRVAMEQLIAHPSSRLYAGMTIDDATRKMREDLTIRRAVAQEQELRITFAYTDKAKARAVVDRLAADAVSMSLGMNFIRADAYRDIWPQLLLPAPGPDAQILAAASVSENPVGPNRPAFIAVGVGAGFLLGVLVAFAMHRPKRALWFAGCALCGAGVALAVAFAIPDTYTSTAVMDLLPPRFPERPSGAALATSMAERLRRSQQEVFSPASLAEIVQRPSLDLYAGDRARKPLEEVVETMRTRDLAVRALSALAAAPDNGFAFSISFSYPDNQKAHKVVEAIVSKLMSHWVLAQRALHKDMKPGDELFEVTARHLGDQLEVLDPASLPDVPAAPNRTRFAVSGMGSGLLFGSLVLRMRRIGAQKLRMV